MIGTTECAKRSGSARRGVSLVTPVAIVASVSTSATPAEKHTSAKVSGSTRDADIDCTSLSHGVDSRKESKAVLPKSTPTTATRPGPRHQGVEVGQRAADHERGRRARPQTDSFATSEE